MNVHRLIPRDKLIRFGKGLAEFRKRVAKHEQSQYGWYDEHGVRQGGLIAFVRHFWDILEPGRPFVDGWPLWAMCEHLEAVSAGRITRLLINVPPGFMKSLLVNCFWPAWEWGPMALTNLRYVSFSYSASLTERDNDKFRILITHERYQVLYGPIRTRIVQGEREEIVEGVSLRNKTTVKVMNTATGWKLASSVAGVATGERGDRVIIDDPHNVVEAESEVERNNAIRWFRESVSSRFNDLDTGALIIIMQRVHEDDVSGVALSPDFDYCHLMIPWHYDCERQVWQPGEAQDNGLEPGAPKCTDIGWFDPRYNEKDPAAADGEPAWIERFSEDAIGRTKRAIGPNGWAAQYQQRPAPRGGGIFQTEWWQVWEHPENKFPELEYVVASLDGAYTEDEENDPSALTVWGIFRLTDDDRTLFLPDVNAQVHVGGTMPMVAETVRGNQRRIILLHAWSKFLKFSGPRIPTKPGESPAVYRRRTMQHWGLMEWTVDTCNRFKVDRLLIEAKASGISAAQELQNRFGRQRWSVVLCPVKGDKVARALSVQPTFSQLLVYAPVRDWADDVIQEMAKFPKGKHDDFTDSATQAIKHLRDVGLAQTDEEVHDRTVDRITHRGRVKPLYPV